MTPIRYFHSGDEACVRSGAVEQGIEEGLKAHKGLLGG